MDIGNWRAIVTGHSSGLGFALAHALLDRGMTVLGISRRRVNGSVPAGLQQRSLDLSDTAALRDWLDGPELREFLSPGDRVLLINNAGTLGPVGMPGTQSGAAIARAIALNVTAPLMLTDGVLAASAHAIERRIAHVSSGAAATPYAGQWVAKSDTGATVATIRIDAKEQVWVDGKKVKARRSDGGLVFKAGKITFMIQGDRRLKGEDVWTDSDAKTKGPIVAG